MLQFRVTPSMVDTMLFRVTSPIPRTNRARPRAGGGHQ